MTDAVSGEAESRWRRRFAVAVCCGLAALYLLTRPASLISDGNEWILEAGLGDPARTWYGFPSYFLQIPLAHLIWRLLHGLGLAASAGQVFLALSLAGTVGAGVFVGLIAAEILSAREAAWLAAILFGASVNPWTQWNGELSGLAVGFSAAGLFFALRGALVVPALLWGLSVLSQVNFVLVAPAFVVAVWMSRPPSATTMRTLLRAAALLVLAGSACLLAFLAGSRAVGKWHDVSGLEDWLLRSFRSADRSVLTKPEVFRALKGLVTAHTAAGHIARDAFTQRSMFHNPAFVAAAIVGFALLAAIVWLLAQSLRKPGAALFALAWLLPFHVGFNWWWAPTEEEYHAGALPGLVLLLTAGLLQVGSAMPARRRYALYAAYAVACVGLNLFAVILPRHVVAEQVIASAREIRRLNDEHQGRAVLITCDGGNVIAVQNAGLEYLRVRSMWRGSVADVQQEILAWTRARIAEGKQPYVLERWCTPENWKTSASKAPFDLYFLARDFRLVPTGIDAVPTEQGSATDPFIWKRGDLVRLDAPGGTGR